MPDIFSLHALREFTPNLRAIKHWLKRRCCYRPLHLTYTAWRARHRGLPKWHVLLGPDMPWQGHEESPGEAHERVLIATGTPGHLPSMTLESMLGVALSLRGADIDFLLCDGTLSACMMSEINWYPDVASFARNGPRDRCKACYRPSVEMLDKTGFRHFGIGGQLTDSERESARTLAATVERQAIANFSVEGVPIGEHATAGALRFFARGDMLAEPEADAVLRRYLEAALLTHYACRRLLAAGGYKVVVLNHGIYVPQGVIAETARSMGIRVVTWHPAYRKGCFIFNHDETYHHGLLSEPVSLWQDMHWGPWHRSRIEQYLRSRWIGRQDWVSFHRDPEFDVAKIEQETGIDFSRPTIGLLTNVVWDAQLHYQANAFVDMLDWLVKTIRYFAARPDLQLLIRVHPAELTGTLPSRQPAVAEIHKAFAQQLPQNVFIIPPESRLSTYVAMSQCNAVLIYGTKTGVELTASGIPVIVAGEAWIKGKGVTMDACSEADYFEHLDALPLPARLDEPTRERALKYAYHFFFRRMIPLNFMQQASGWPPFAVSIGGTWDLEPGASRGLDLICQGILNGNPFVYPAETLEERAETSTGA